MGGAAPLSVRHPQLVRATARFVVGLVCVGLLTVGALVVRASGGPQGPVLLVNQAVAGPQTAPSVGSDGAGGWATAWRSGDAVLVRTSGSDEQPVSDATSPATGPPSVSLGGDGRFIVVWPGQRVGGPTPVPVTFGRFYSVAGAPLSGVLELSSGAGGVAGATASIYLSGDVLAAWVVWQEAAPVPTLHGRKVGLLPGGEVTMDLVPVALPGVPAGATAPRVAADAGGAAAVVWRNAATGGVELLAFDAQFGALGSLQALGAGTDPAVDRTPSGSTIVTWAGPAGGDPDGGILVQRFDGSGAPLGGPWLANTTLVGALQTPTVGIADDTRFVVVWRGANLALQRFGLEATPIGAETRVDPPEVTATGAPQLSMGPGGGYDVVWPGAAAADPDGIYQLRFTYDDPPVGGPDSYTVTHDTPLTVLAPQGLLANDTDNDGDQLQVHQFPSTPPAHGTVTLNADGSFTYQPNPGVGASADVVDTFTYVVTDLRHDVVTPVQITISSTNVNPPVANDDSYTTPQGQQLAVPAPGVLANDVDVDGDRLTTFTDFANPPNGDVQVFEDGSFLYTPVPTYCGPDTFEYYAFDGVHYSDVATVTVLVPCVQAPPEARPDRYTTPEGTTLVVPSPGVLANDRDPNLDNMVARPVQQPANGTLDLGFDGEFTYTPNPGFTGDDTFTYVADDGRVSSAPATVTITVTPVLNDLEAVVDDYVVDQDGVLAVPAPGVLINDRGLAHRTLTVSAGSPPANGTLELNADGSFVYAPSPGFVGADRFGYVVADGSGARAESTVTITVTPGSATTTPAGGGPAIVATPVAGSPAAAAGAPVTIPPAPPPIGGGGGGAGGGSAGGGAAGAAGGPGSGEGGGEASGGDGGDGGDGGPTETAKLDIGADEDEAVTIATQPQNGEAFANPDRTITYQPARHFSGRDEFAYSVCDGAGTCEEGTGGVTVLTQPDGSRRIVFDPVGRGFGDERPRWIGVAIAVLVGVVALALVLPLARKAVPGPGGLRAPSPPRRRRIPRPA